MFLHTAGTNTSVPPPIRLVRQSRGMASAAAPGVTLLDQTRDRVLDGIYDTLNVTSAILRKAQDRQVDGRSLAWSASGDDVFFVSTEQLLPLQYNPYRKDSMKRAVEKYITNRQKMDEIPMLKIAVDGEIAYVYEGNHRVWAFAALGLKWCPVKVQVEEDVSFVSDWQRARSDTLKPPRQNYKYPHRLGEYNLGDTNSHPSAAALRGFGFDVLDVDGLTVSKQAYALVNGKKCDDFESRAAYQIALGALVPSPDDENAAAQKRSRDERGRKRRVDGVGSCVTCSVRRAEFLCTGCRVAAYCSKACQKIDWEENTHHIGCNM